MKTTLVLILTISFVIGCGGGPKWIAPETDSQTAAQLTESTRTGLERSSGVVAPTIEIPDFILSFETEYKIRTDHPDSVHDRVEEIAVKYGGVVMESHDNRTLIRVRAGRQEEAENEIEQLGEVTDRRMIGRDLTETHYDLDSRLAHAVKARAKYLEQLELAETPEEIREIENELGRLSKIIDAINGRIRKLERVVKYAAITVKTHRGVKPGLLVEGLGYVFHAAKSLFIR